MKPQQLVSIQDSAPLIERVSGARPHVSTIHRWVRKGVCGVRLKARFGPGGLKTCEEWVTRFFDDVTARKLHGDCDDVSPNITASKRVDRAEAMLKREHA